jgi:hypothetical protein
VVKVDIGEEGGMMQNMGDVVVGESLLNEKSFVCM